MGKIIRRTRTIIVTVTETWTFQWANEDDPPPSTFAAVQAGQAAPEQTAETPPIHVCAIEVEESQAMITTTQVDEEEEAVGQDKELKAPS
jgi:hypothetical protein